MILYHGTFNNILSPFKPLTHFGTEKAAVERIEKLVEYATKAKKILLSKKIKMIPSWQKERLEMRVSKIESGPFLYKVSVNIKNPARIIDAPVEHSINQFAFALRERKLITQIEMTDITYCMDDEEKSERLLKLLTSKGYDGFVYKNKYEDKGNDSFVILSGKQAKILSKKSYQADIT